MTLLSETLRHNDSWQQLALTPVGQIMSKDVLTAYEGWSIKRLAGFFVKHKLSGAPVIASDNELVGVVTQGDVVAFESRDLSDREVEKLVINYCGPHGGSLTAQDMIHFRERANEHCTVNEIMTPHVYAVDSSVPIASACKLIVDHHVHRLFVTENDSLVGVVTAMDVIRRLV